jgi:hypothetical protein
METTPVKKPLVIETNTDFEVRSLDTASLNESELTHPWWHNLKYFVAGILFGIILVKAEIISWFRIQEMFRLESFHMYGVIGSAIVVDSARTANPIAECRALSTPCREKGSWRSCFDLLVRTRDT